MLGAGNIVSKPSRGGGGRGPHYDNDPASNLPFEIIEGDPGVSGSAGSRQYSK